ncbi:hypothetical protein VF_A0684 [Aliivibrio fischeri ES114]|uniref:Uncharacterized protein n=1 Tax=Aliivibrio fischeri (strain ATCC 700601 / ES114) TaxID=312309 RepID=Q5DZP2_ALIF1|nr:hypothetical protein VF_A0684 [Aliivibrio fischeri ES114]
MRKPLVKNYKYEESTYLDEIKKEWKCWGVVRD